MRGRGKSRTHGADVELRFQARVDENERPVNIARIRGLIVRLAINAWRRRQEGGAENVTSFPSQASRQNGEAA